MKFGKAIQRTLTGVTIGLLLLTLLWAGTSSNPAYGSGFTPDYEVNEIVVKLADGVAMADINANYGTTTIRALLNSGGIYLLQAAGGADIELLLEAMNQDQRLLYAERNFIGAAPEANPSEVFAWPEGESYQLQTTETTAGTTQETSLASPRELYQWTLSGSDQAHYYQQTAIHNLFLSNAHDISQGQGMIVAVLDTGVDLSHPLLASHLTSISYDFVDDDAVAQDEFSQQDNDHDGYIDEVAGHGTHVAGVIHLVAPQAQIMPLRVLDSEGNGNIFVIAEAIMFAIHNGADVINLSLGTPQNSAFLLDVLQEARAEGVVVVGSAGNLDLDLAQFPAAAPCTLAVTAVGPGLQKTTYASYGSWIDIAAPGKEIFSTYPGGEFARWNGTSMAAPFVSGQAALLLSHSPQLNLEELGLLIGGTAVSLDNANNGYEGLLGSGRINIGASLDMLDAGQWPAGGQALLTGCGQGGG